MKIIATLSLLLTWHCHAAVSILIEPGATPGTTLFTVTQTSPSPVLAVSGISGYASGMSIPTAMFNIPGMGPGLSTDVLGILSNSLATITEFYSGQTFQLDHLRVASNGGPSLLGFDHLFTLPTGHPYVRFDVDSPAPVEINIAYEGLVPGVYTMGDTLFGSITYTVIPEPSSLVLAAVASTILLGRRRTSVAGLPV